MNDAADPEATNRRLLAILVPLAGILVVSTIATIAFQTQQAQRAQGSTPVSTATIAFDGTTSDTDEAVAEAQSTLVAVAPTIARATPFGVLGLGESATPETLPATPLPELASIRLLGPPAGSQYRLDDRVTFYWDWPERLDDTMHFALYLNGGTDSVLGGLIEEANLGLVQQLTLRPSDAGLNSTNYVWYVAVEDQTTGVVQTQSEQRPITFLAGDN